jgi:hypothetical protein
MRDTAEVPQQAHHAHLQVVALAPDCLHCGFQHVLRALAAAQVEDQLQQKPHSSIYTPVSIAVHCLKTMRNGIDTI